jgi:putative DNA primase/helicase
VRDDVRAALFKISPDCSQGTWWRVARALYSEFGDDAFDLFDEWSSTSKHDKYPGRDGCRRQWECSKQYEQITIGTLFYLAKIGVGVDQ